MRAVICGGGIAGLATALCLHRRGWDVTVLEQAPAIGEVGAGIQVSPNGFRVLEALGIGDAIRRAAYEPDVVEMRMGVSGRRLMSIPMKSIATKRWGAPFLQIHRAALIEVLRQALVRLAPDALHTGVKVLGFEQSASGAAAHTSSGVFEGDLVIGADGVRSRIRDQMLGPEAPQFTGNVAWRAVIPMERLAGLEIPPGACIWAGAGRHAVTYPVSQGRALNFVGIVEQDNWRLESWTETGAKEDALADFAGWSALIPAAVNASDAMFRWALFGRAPLPRWSEGRVVLVGDACHPMLPSLAQGACQAMEDAWVLAMNVSGRQLIEDGLARYHSSRKPRTSKIQRGAADNVRLFHKSGVLSKSIAYAPILVASQIAPGVIHGRNDWIYRHNVTAG